MSNQLGSTPFCENIGPSCPGYVEWYSGATGGCGVNQCTAPTSTPGPTSTPIPPINTPTPTPTLTPTLTPTPTPLSNSITGVIFVDENGNRSRDSGEPGFGGVSIGAFGPQTYNDTTLSDGSYSFTGIVPGFYTVLFTVPSNYVVSTGFGNGFSANIPPSKNVDMGIKPEISGTISIENGAACTTSQFVSLSLSCTVKPPGYPPCQEMQISNTSQGIFSEPIQGYVTSKQHNLSSGTGTKAVYVRYRYSSSAFWSNQFVDTIELKTSCP